MIVPKCYSKKNVAAILAATTLTTNLVSRILFLNYHLSAFVITNEMLLPTLYLERTALKNGTIRGITAPKVYPCNALLQSIVSFYLTFSPSPLPAVIFCGTFCFCFSRTRLLTGGLSCAVQTFLFATNAKR